MTIQYAKKADKALNKLDADVKARIKKGIGELPAGDVKKLADHTRFYRLRIGKWRINFSYLEEDVILIEKISSRGEAYKGGRVWIWTV